MDLATFLKERQIRVPDFAQRIGRSRKQVYEYLAGNATPKPGVMLRIMEATGGEVTANDFLPVRE